MLTTRRPVYKGSFTWSWNTTSGTSQATLGPSVYFRFNVVKVEAITFIDLATGFPPLPAPSPLFVGVNEIIPICFDYVAGTNVKTVGGAQWGGGAYLIVNEIMAPFKRTSENVDLLRGSLTFNIYDSTGAILTTPNPSYKAVTISFWESDERISSTS